MMAVDVVRCMELLTMLVTLLMFGTGISPCIHMYKTRDTRNVPFHIFLLSTISCSGMFHYGLMIENNTLVLLNAVGMVLQALYVALFLILAPQKNRALLYFTLGVMYVCGLYYYLYSVIVTQPDLADTLGMMSSLLTTVIVCMPALEVVGNIRNKNADGMPMIMLLGGLACSSCWLVYGYMLNDPNIYAPNIPGLVITGVKLIVIQIYADKVKVA